MKSIEYLKSELSELSKKFDISIRYEPISYMSLHIIEILPLGIFDSVPFTLETIKFENNFMERFKSEEILFISKDSLNKIESPIMVINR